MKVTVFGASGKVGRQVVEFALAQNLEVVAFVHSKNPFDDQTGLSIVKGDISDSVAVKKAVEDSDAVISALGSWGTKDKNILAVGMGNIIPAMQASKPTRLITLTGSGATWSGDKPSIFDKASHVFLGLAARKILVDGEEHLRLLDNSDLDWTSIRSPVMSGKASSVYKLSNKPPSLIARVPRQAVAQSLIDQINDIDFIRQAPHIHHA